MAKIFIERCKDCRKEAWHEYQSHTKHSLVATCGLCGATSDLKPDGRVLIDESTQEHIEL